MLLRDADPMSAPSPARRLVVAALALVVAMLMSGIELIAGVVVLRWRFDDLIYLSACVFAGIQIVGFALDVRQRRSDAPAALLLPAAVVLAGFIVLDGTGSVLPTDWAEGLRALFAVVAVVSAAYAIRVCYLSFDELKDTATGALGRLSTIEPLRTGAAQPAAVTPSSDSAAVAPDAPPVPRTCSSCGNATRPGQRFCGRCGHALA